MTEYGPRIVIGLDYGTTATGLSWVEIQDGILPSLSDLRVFKEWPEKEAPKVPSDFSYSESIHGKGQWGYDIDDDSLVVRWTKLNLETRDTATELQIVEDLVRGLDRLRHFQETKVNMPQHLARGASEIVRDYLIKLVREWYIWMRSQPGPRQHLLKSVPVELVVTHPAAWSYDAINTIYRAVNASFSKSMFPTLQKVIFISEPEACALYTIKDLSRQLLLDRLVEGDCFVLCDAGGGTVDVVSYLLESTSPLKISRVGQVAGDKCGATCVDRAFLAWLNEKVQNLNISPNDVGSGGHVVQTKECRVMLQRFERVKHAFDGEITGEVQLLRGLICREGHESSVVNGKVKVTKDDLRTMFSKSVDRSIELIKRQVAQVQNPRSGQAPGLVSHVFLAGGFAENPFFHKEVERYGKRNGMIVRKADDCWSGVVKGAVLTGIGRGDEMVAATSKCPRHYGFCVDRKYDNVSDMSVTPIYRKYSSGLFVPNQVVWLVHQNDVILPNGPTVASFDVRFNFRLTTNPYFKLQLRFVASADGSPASDIKSISAEENEIVVMQIDFQQVRCCVQRVKGKGTFSHHQEVRVIAEIQVEPTLVTATLRCCQNVLATHKTYP